MYESVGDVLGWVWRLPLQGMMLCLQWPPHMVSTLSSIVGKKLTYDYILITVRRWPWFQIGEEIIPVPCLLACLPACLPARPLVCLFVCLFIGSVVFRSFVCSFVCLFVRLFVCLLYSSDLIQFIDHIFFYFHLCFCVSRFCKRLHKKLHW